MSITSPGTLAGLCVIEPAGPGYMAVKLDGVGRHRPTPRLFRSCAPCTPATGAVDAKVLWR
ncbi:hypothetical protein AB0H20_27500 [Nocardia fluminea]|uniref:hypothetical protein n=1 Tax=Nocardia fluminea TaxID=134984 RepID=UPI0033D41670